MTESLPADVADVLAAVLNTDNPVHDALSVVVESDFSVFVIARSWY
ncbi:hypothetical protein [Streptomyces sp. NPDC058664]